MAGDWTPQEVAAYDQLLAQAGLDLDSWTAAWREQAAEHGEMQGLANITLGLVSTCDRTTLAGMLAVALTRLAERHGNPEPRGDTRS